MRLNLSTVLKKGSRNKKFGHTILPIFIVNIFFLFSGIAFAQFDSSERIPSIRDGLREQYSDVDFQLFLQRESSGEIHFQGGVVDSPDATDVLVNNNTGSTGTSYFTQSETSILSFGSTVLIGFNDSGSNSGGANKFTGFSYSADGGNTFTDGGTLPTNAGGDAGDPVLARNESTGRIYLSTLGFNVSTIQVFRSDDNGQTWLAPVNGTPGGSGEDKQWITVDNYPGSGNGNVYLISRRFSGTPGIYVFRSLDNGATFGPTGGTLITSTSPMQGAFIAVAPDHSVYAFWFAGTTIQVRKSTDFGVTFSAPITVASGLVGGVNGDLSLTGLRQGTATYTGFRSNEFPHASINPVSGHIYVTFANDGAGSDKADIFMVMSTNGGTSWSAANKVNDDATTTDQWMPTIAVLPDGSKLGIFYYSRQEDPANNNSFKYYGRIGSISGSTVTFDPSLAISDVTSLPEFGRDATVNTLYMGDYNHASVTASPNAFHVVWSDNRDDLPGGAPRKDPNVYYEKISVGPAQFLVWDGTIGGQDYSGTYIENFLTGLSYTVDHTSVFPADLTPYQAVFLCFGMYPGNTAFDAIKAAIVQNYLEAGGRVYLEGNDALEFDQGVNESLHNLFGIGDGSDGGTNVIDGLQGQVGSITEGMLFSASTQVSNGFIDIYVPVAGKSAFIESAYGDVAVQHSGSFGQKTFCFSYALAYLTDGSFPSTKNELITRILNFLIGPPALPPDINVNPASLTFNLSPGGNDSDIITISNIGEQTLIWNLFEQDQTTTVAKLKMPDGKELPVSIQPKFDWSKPIKGEDYVPLPLSGGAPPSDINFKPLYGYESIENPVLFGTDAFSTETVNGNYVQFDLGVPQILNPITPLADYIWAGDFGIDLTFAYAVNSVTNRFIKINKTTGAITDVGPCSPTQFPGSEYFTGMAIDPTTGNVYVSSTNEATSTSWLYTVNKSTGTPTLIGVLTNAPLMIAIAINNNGQMYGYDMINDVMLSINKTTAAGTIIGPIGFNAGFGQGMDFDPITGTLYLSAFNASTFQAELRTGNTTTGSTTLVGLLGSTTPGGLVQLGWLGLPGEYFDCTWLSENPVSGLIPASGNQVVDVYVDATGLTPGTYNCDLIISSNDPNNPSIIVPVTLNIILYPDVNVTPTVLTFVVPEGGNDTQILTIENTAPAGSGNLDWGIIEQSTLLLDNGVELPISLKMSTSSNQVFQNNETQKVSFKDYISLGIESNSEKSLFWESQSNFTDGGQVPQHSVLVDPGMDASRILNDNVDAPVLDISMLVSGPVYGQNLTGVCPNAGDWIRFPITTLIPTTLGNNAAVQLFGGDFNANGILYAIDNLSRNTVIVDTSNGTTVIIGPSGIPVGETHTGLAYDLTTATMYGSSNSSIYTVNLSTGTWTLVATVTGLISPIIIDIAIHPVSGQMYGHDIFNDQIVTINKVSGVAAPLIATGFPSNFAQGMSFDRTTGTLYCYAYQGGGVNNLLAVDVNTPSVTNLGSLPCQELDVFAIAGQSNIPWISENPVNGSVPSGSNQNVDVIVDATGLSAGTYNCNLSIVSNDPDENPVLVPVTLIVYSGPPPENFGIVTNALNNNIHIINVDNNTIIGPLLSGNVGNGYLLDPVITPDGEKALISSFIEQRVYFIDIVNPYNISVGGFVDIGFAAEDIALTPDGAYALVTDGGNSTKIAVIDVGTMSLIQTLDIAPREAYAVDIASNGTVLISDFDNNQIHVLLMNLSTGLLTDLSTAISVGTGPINVSIGPDGQTAAVANSGMTSINILHITAPGTVVSSGTIPNILNASSIAFEKNGNRAFVVQTGTSPDALAVLSVTSPGNVIDTGTRVNLISDAFAGAALYGVDVIDISSNGNWAYVGNPDAFLANNDVAVVDLNTYTLAPNLTAGIYPTGIAISGSNTFQLSVNVANGWNMVSIPGLHPTDQNVNTWWAFRDPGANVFRYSAGYQVVTTATPGIGYWMKHTGARTYNTGDEWPASGINIVPHDPIAGAAGWNLFGGYELSVTAANVTTNPPGLQSGPIFGYSNGYFTPTTLNPGYGYWIKLNAAGQIIIPETLSKDGNPVEYFPENWGRIILTDATGINYTLYGVKGEVDLSQYDLPPAPPAGMFDIRFNSGRIAENLNSSVKAIDMSGVTYPLTVRVEGMDIRLMDESGKMINTNLKSGEDVVISDATIQKLMVNGEMLPTVYSLEQNYPNPFNPSTVIEFSLPEDVASVKLSIYNALGEKVAELVNTSLQAGRYQYQWNARDVATGMYIYELRTDNFVSVKKMLLLK